MGFLATTVFRRRWSAVFALAAATLAAVAAAASSPARDHIYAVSIVDADNAWAAGAFGTIVRTRDRGATWEPQASATEEHLFGVGFANHEVGWVVGRTGVIRHTRDGGATWQVQKSPLDDRHLFHVAAVDSMHAVAIGDWGTVVVTSDGGRTWVDRSLDRDVILNGQHWADPSLGWLVGEGGAVFTTADGGRTWAERDAGVFKTLFGVSFADRRRGWAAGLDGLIVATEDGGESWTVVRGSAGLDVFEEVEFDDALRNPTLFDIAVRGRFGVAVGDLGAVFTSADGGATWERQELDGGASLRWIRAVALTPDGDGFAVGARGLLLRAAAGRIEVGAAAPEAPVEP